MKKFKQFIQEAPIPNDIIKEPGLKPYQENPENASQREHLSTLKGHKVSVLHSIDSHYALHEPDDRISLGVSGKQIGNKFYEENLNGFGNKIPAHEFYHHLITQHGIHLHSDYTLSKGAIAVWSKLHQTPGIKMQAYNMGTRKYTSIPKNEPLTNYMNKSSIRFAASKDEN